MVAVALSSLPQGGDPKAPPGISPTDSLVVVVAPSSLLCGGGRYSLPVINPSFPFQIFLEYLL